MTTTEETQSMKEAVELALFQKLIDMINAYIEDTGVSPIKELMIDDILFVDNFQEQLENHIVHWKIAKNIFVQKLKSSAYSAAKFNTETI